MIVARMTIHFILRIGTPINIIFIAAIPPDAELAHVFGCQRLIVEGKLEVVADIAEIILYGHLILAAIRFHHQIAAIARKYCIGQFGIIKQQGIDFRAAFPNHILPMTSGKHIGIG